MHKKRIDKNDKLNYNTSIKKLLCRTKIYKIMKTIIKLYGKITGIAPLDQNSVNVRMSCYGVKIKRQQQWQELLTKQSLPQTIVIPYQGPVHLSQKETEEFSISSENVQNIYGTGANISDLFINDEIEVYLRRSVNLDCCNQEHVIVDQVIISPVKAKPKDLLTFIRETD